MDILIKGLALPKKGESCINLKIYSDGTVHGIGMYGEIIPNKATAIELSPHGRLIDADDLANCYADLEADNAEYAEDAGETLRTIQNAPTIVEASNGSDS